ncbi:MAG: T9SS type A sorting domain-containing protein [Chitinophagales bacterium]
MKRNVFITVCIALAVSTGIFFSQGEDKSVEGPVNNKLPKAQRIDKALEWRKELLADPATGEFDVNLLYTALAKADELKSQANKSGVLGLNWELVGPDNQGGRTRALIFDRIVPNKLWAGSVGGGLFKSLDGGNNWTRVVTYDGFFPIGSITQASDGSLYVGTGEGLGNSLSGAGNSFNSQSPGNGVYKSSDDGITWTLLPGTDAGNSPNITTGGCIWCGVNDITVSPVDDNVILAATQNGLFVSTQAGTEASWTQANGLSGEGQAIEITSDGQTAFAAFNGRVYRSIDVSSNFTTGWALMPVTGGQRADVAIAPSNENYVYASVSANNNCLSGIWQSQDGGDNWTKVQDGGAPYVLDPFNQPTSDFGTCEGQGWYDHTIAVNPADETKVYIGGITFYTWGEGVGFKRADVIDTEGGDPFNSQYIHADKHEIIFNPLDLSGNTMLVGSDGGVTLCNNATSGFPDNLNFIQKNKGYATLQVYGMGAGSAGEVLSGNQDNGSQYIDGLGSSPQAAQEVTGGDGVYAEVSNLDPDFLFSGVYYGDLRRSVNRGASANAFLDGNIDRESCGKITCTTGGSACQTNYASFIYPFYLMETSNAGQQDTTASLTARNDTLLLASGATQFIIDTLFPTYSVTVRTTVGESETTVEREETPRSTYTFSSRVSDKITFEQAITSVVLPGETLFVNDPYDAKYFVPSTSCGLWMCLNPLQASQEPVFYRISNFSNARAFDNSYDGDILFFSVANRVYRISGLNLIHQTLDPNGCFNTSCAPNLNVTLVATISGVGSIQGIGVDKSNADNVLVTASGFSQNGKVYRIENATTNSPNVVNLHQTDATLPRMPIYDCIIDFDNPSRYVVASELGIWTSDDAGATWSEDNDGMFGRMPVYRLRQEWMYEEDCMILYAGTHGGGMFRCATLTSGGCDIVPFQWEKIDGVSGIKEVSTVASNISLYPNPVSSIANISFDLNQTSNIELKVIDLTGRVVISTNFGTAASGEHTIEMNTSDLTTNTYYAVLSANGKVLGSKLFIKK